MPWAIVTLLVGSLQSASPPPTRPACPPPPEWGATSRYERWSVLRGCAPGIGIDTLLVGAKAEEATVGGFSFLCNKDDGAAGRIALFGIQKVQIGDLVSVTFTGNTAPALALQALGADLGVGSRPAIELETAPATTRFLVSLADGPGPSFTLVLTPRGKASFELTFLRAGLATALKPLRSKCGW